MKQKVSRRCNTQKKQLPQQWFVSVLLVFLIALGVCACSALRFFGSEPRRFFIRTYDELPQEKNIHFETDNVFFDGTLPKKAPWIDYSLSYDSDERGYVGVLRYDVRTGYAGYYIRLKQKPPVEYSAYNTLEFWIKGDCDKMQVEIKGSRVHTYVVRDITTEWQKVIIPFKQFTYPEAFEYDTFKEIVFVLSRDQAKQRTGIVLIDDIAFTFIKEKEHDVRVKSSFVVANGVDLQKRSHFPASDIVLDIFLEGAPSLNEVQMRIEACGPDKVWFLIDQKPVRDYRVTGYWDARFSPSHEYTLRFQLVKNNEILFTSDEYTLSLSNAYDSREFIETVLHDTFKYFLYEHQPETYLTKDRSGESNIISTGACGFALSVYPLAAERGFISSAEALKRIDAILTTYLEKVPRIEGFYQHWFDFAYDPVFDLQGVDSVESSYLAAGALFCINYYRGETAAERSIRDKAEKIVQNMNWPFMLGAKKEGSSGPLYWLYAKKDNRFWHPVIGFNECLITYIMALSSSRSISLSDFSHWYSDYNYKYFYGKKVVFFPTLFTQHYSFMWLDPRNLKDAWVEYFKNAILATNINREYSLVVQDEKIWGLSACDGPDGYKAYGVDLPFEQSFYDGTITPSASLGSLPYAPIPVIANVRRIYELHRSHAYGAYGFYDSFNLKRNWSSQSFLGITQGMIYLQLENYLAGGSVWEVFMRDERIRKALARAGFSL
jgi:hypothetical protein